jgi:PPM family protein phosphatase
VITFGNAQIRGARQGQEDYFATFKAGGMPCAIVADGMGGHVAGAVASELAVKSFREYLLNHADRVAGHPAGLLRLALEQANRVLADWVTQQPKYDGMGTTLVAIALHGHQLFHISVGDSPLYCLRAGKLLRINANHAFAEALQEAVAAGEISEETASTHPDRSAITSALSGEPLTEVDGPADGAAIRPGDSYLLASDGVHSLPDAEICRIMTAAPNAQRAADDLVAAIIALNAPQQDNATVIVVHVLGERITQPLRNRA